MNETLRELDHRTNDRIDVWLLWREHDNQVLVAVADDKTGDRFTIELREGERPSTSSITRTPTPPGTASRSSAEPRRRLEVRGGRSA